MEKHINKTMKQVKFALFVTLTLSAFSPVAQNIEAVREFLFLNYISDIGIHTKNDICSNDAFFQAGTIEASPKYVLNRKAMKHEEYISDSVDYCVQFYKVLWLDNVDGLYLIHLVDELSRNIDVWIRVKGWRENDMRFLYLMYKKNGLQERDFRHMVQAWGSLGSSIAREIPWDKMVKGAIRNKMEDDCFISEHYKLLDSLRSRDGLKTPVRNLYSVFSRQPMSGMWMEF